MPVTTIDIARRVGLSQSTVSRVLSGSPGSRISPETRQLVVDAAREMGYYPNVLARSLIRRRTNNIGFYWSPPTREEYFTPQAFRTYIEAGLFAGCVDAHYDLLYHSSLIGGDVDTMYADIHNGKVDGLILLASPTDPLTERLQTSSLPLVNIVDPNPAFPSVVADDVGAGRLLAEHIAKRGCRRLVVVESGMPISAVERRLSALRSASEGYGVKLALTIACTSPDEFTGDAAASLLDEARRGRTAVVCWTERLCPAVVEILERGGVSVPGDGCVAGFDGLGAFGRQGRMITSVKMPWMDVARTAVGMLSKRIEGEEIPRETIVGGCELAIGET